MTDTVTYRFEFGRIGQYTNVAPLTVSADDDPENRLLSYIALHLTVAGSRPTLEGHPDSNLRSVTVTEPNQPPGKFDDKIATVSTYRNDPTCNGTHTSSDTT